MERKKIIQIIVIAAGFIGSGVVLYNGLYSSPKAASVPVPVVGAGSAGMPGNASSAAPSSGSGALLPDCGKPCYLSNWQDGRFQCGAVSFASISTSTDIGVDVPDLIK